MKYTCLPNTDIKVSKICLGTMTFGNQNTIEESEEQMDYALDRGVNFFDTAELYAVMPRKETYGKTVFKYLFEHKMELALKLLKDGENNVNEVSFKLGYSNASHFIYAFKKRFGITPRAYMIES